VITTVCVPIAGSTNISYKQGLNDPNCGLLATQDKSAYSKRGNNLDNWGITESIDLTQHHSAMLIFFQDYDIVPVGGSDTGYVKISDNGGSSWTTLKEVQGQTIDWEQNFVEINQWAGKTILIGFEYKTGGSSISQGWYVDKIAIDTEEGIVYLEDFEDYNVGDHWGDWVVTVKSSLNTPPIPPQIDGQNNGNINTLYEYSFLSFDPELDNISYYIEWGDGNITDWTEFQSGDASSAYREQHKWSEEGTFTIKAKAKDPNGLESDWGTLKVTVPKNKPIIDRPVLKFIQQHPNLFLTLRQLLLKL